LADKILEKYPQRMNLLYPSLRCGLWPQQKLVIELHSGSIPQSGCQQTGSLKGPQQDGRGPGMCRGHCNFGRSDALFMGSERVGTEDKLGAFVLFQVVVAFPLASIREPSYDKSLHD
jgi:hypothetical protein